MEHGLGLQGELADLLDRQTLDVDAVGSMRAVAATGAFEDLGEGGGVGGAHSHPALGVAVDELRNRALLDQPSTTDDDEVVGHQRDLGEEMAADEDRPPVPGEGHEHVADPAHALGIESVGRLVEDQRVRIAEQDTGEPETLAHAERVAAHLALGDGSHPDGFEHGVDPGDVDAVARGHPAKVVAPGSGGVHVAGVEERSDLVHRSIELAVLLAVEAGRAALETVEPEHAAHRRALARAVGTEEPGHPTGMDVEAEVVDGDGAAEALGDLADLDHRCRLMS